MVLPAGGFTMRCSAFRFRYVAFRRTALFNGAAVSAFFAVILVIIFTVRTKLTTGMSSVMFKCRTDLNSSTGRHTETKSLLLLAGLCHILHDIHTQRAVSPRLTLRKRVHGCTDLHVCSSYMQYCHTRKHIYTLLLTLAHDLRVVTSSQRT